jgi:hypothetical protein
LRPGEDLAGARHPSGLGPVHGEVEELAPDDLREFAALSLVNELDVAENAPGFGHEHGRYFRGLVASWTPLLSPELLVEADRILGVVSEA